MREIITLQAGQCGNQIGHHFWQTVSGEHGIDRQGHYNGEEDKQLKRMPVFYNESSTGRFVPRALLFDMEPGTLNFVRSDEWGSLYHPNSYIFGRTGAGNNWAKGFYGDGAQLVTAVKDQVRKMMESCTSPQGICTFHSTGGGTGSGCCSLLMEYFKADYVKLVRQSYSIYPSPQVSDVVVEPYNCVLTQNRLISEIDITVCLDNEALYSICSDTLEIMNPTYADLNRLCSLVVCGLTSSLRFPGKLNIDLRKNLVNLVPQPRLHFLCPSFAPLHTPRVDDYRNFSVADLTTQAFDANNLMCHIDPRSGKFLACGMIYRGDCATQQVDEEILRIQTQYSNNFVDFIPHNIKTSVVDVPHSGFTRSATMLCNTTSIIGMFRRIDDNFNAMFRKNAFVHWYTNAGMDDQEFSEARANMVDVTESYAVFGEDEGDAEEE
jgi:tubulin beta